MPTHRTLLAALSAALLASACSSNGVGAPASPIVAEVNGRSVTLEELDAKIAPELYDARSEALDGLIAELVIETEAERRGISRDELVNQQIQSLGEVSDDEVAKFFEENRARMRPEETLENIAPEIRRFLERGRQAEALQALRAAASVSVSLEPPRIQVAATGPSLGNDDALVTIVEFSDYQCPFCSRAEPTVKQVLAKYPDSVRLVYRHFPLDSIHPQARPAAIAAVCADEQGKFWEYHDRVFANQRDLSSQTLAGFADDLGLDRAAFDVCIDSDEAARTVADDLEAGRAAGTTGTPAFYVNGIKLSGARPLEDFVELIEAELERAGGGA
jgi:protein-disulfide isomerase